MIETDQPNATDRVVTIEKLVYGGEGLGRDSGHVILTPFTLPGEKTRIHVTGKKSQLLKGTVAEVMEKSAHRVQAPCPHFGACGGCDYQHMDYGFQVEQKIEILREVLRRVGKLEAPAEIPVIQGEPWAYRNRAQLHVRDGKVGFHEPGSHTLQAIHECRILSPKLQEALAALRKMIKDSRFPRFLRTLELFTNETEVQLNVLSTEQPVAKRFFEWCKEALPGYASGSIPYKASGFTFRVSYGAFFQVNRHLVDALVECALEGASGESAVDLYSGVGLFTLPLAKRFAKVTGVESGISASRDLQANAEAAGVKVQSLQTTAEKYLLSNVMKADFVLADPPRAGLGKQAVKALLTSKPKQLVIVSCDPSTLARDLAALQTAYKLESLTFVDLFPQTYHIETVARLGQI